MTRRLDVVNDIVRIATMSEGFNEWRADITFRTPEAATLEIPGDIEHGGGP